MSLSRRTLLSGLAVTTAFAGLARAADAPSYRNEVEGYGPLVADPLGIFDLPAGFRYQILSQAGEEMSDGLFAPFKFDGMGCLPLGGSKVALIRNHELKPGDVNHGLSGFGQRLAGRVKPDRAYDLDAEGRPLPGGTTTLVYDLKSRRVTRQYASLTGTAVNCAGGITPWGSWLSCEETLLKAGEGVRRDHGWVFEVPATAKGLVDPVPLKGLGRFKHEAACVDPATGVVYLTEDTAESLFYRFLPSRPGELAAGGRLQALGFADGLADSRNWASRDLEVGAWKTARWIDIDGVENPDNDLSKRGHAAGACLFARGEGLFFGKGELYFTCTSGGAAKLGQIVRHRPGATPDQPGETQLFLESTDDKVMDYGDNLIVAPNGHLVICEDRYSDEINHLKGVTPEGKVYTLGRNVFRENAELAGACFSPDGSTLFLNVYWPGITLAITGPWDAFRG